MVRDAPAGPHPGRQLRQLVTLTGSLTPALTLTRTRTRTRTQPPTLILILSQTKPNPNPTPNPTLNPVQAAALCWLSDPAYLAVAFDGIGRNRTLTPTLTLTLTLTLINPQAKIRISY